MKEQQKEGGGAEEEQEKRRIRKKEGETEEAVEEEQGTREFGEVGGAGAEIIGNAGADGGENFSVWAIKS